MGRIFFALSVSLFCTLTANASGLVLQESGVEVSSIDFGDVNQGESATRYIRIFNDTNSVLELVDIAVAGPVSRGAAAITIGSCPWSLMWPGESCFIPVTFSPPHPGKFRGSIEISGAVYDLLLGTTVMEQKSVDIWGQDLPDR